MNKASDKKTDNATQKNIIYRIGWCETLLTFPDELRLKIDDAIKKFVLYGEEPTDPTVLYSMFAVMRDTIKADRERYTAMCEQNRANILKRYDRTQPNTTVNEGNESNTTEYDRTQPNTTATNIIESNIKESKRKEKESNLIEKKLSHESKKKEATFAPPSEGEIRDFCFENNYPDIAEEFFDYYTSNGWKVGKNGMKDWRAAVRSWIHKRKNEQPKNDNKRVNDIWKEVNRKSNYYDIPL